MCRTSCSASRDVPYLLQCLKRCSVPPTVPQEMCRTSCSARHFIMFRTHVTDSRCPQNVQLLFHCLLTVHSRTPTPTAAIRVVLRLCVSLLTSNKLSSAQTRNCSLIESGYLLLVLCPRQLAITDKAADRMMSLKHCDRRLSCQVTFPVSTYADHRSCPLPYVTCNAIRLQFHVLTSVVQFSCHVAAMSKCLQNSAAHALTSCEHDCAHTVYLRVLYDYYSEQ